MNKTLRQLIIFICIVGVCLGIFYGNNKFNSPLNPEELSATLFDKPRAISSFELQDHHGASFTKANLQGKWSLLFFGFTNCPNICPTTLGELNHAEQLLSAHHFPIRPQVVFITVDPERDNLKRLAEYVPAFNKDFIGVTGSPAAITKLTKELGVLFMKVTPNADQPYQIDHSGTVMLFNPKAQLVGIFSMPHDGEQIAQDFEVIASHFGV